MKRARESPDRGGPSRSRGRTDPPKESAVSKLPRDLQVMLQASMRQARGGKAGQRFGTVLGWMGDGGAREVDFYEDRVPDRDNLAYLTLYRCVAAPPRRHRPFPPPRPRRGHPPRGEATPPDPPPQR